MSITKHPNEDPTVRKEWGEMQLKRMIRKERKLKKEIRIYFAAQRDRLITTLDVRKSMTKGLLDESFNQSLEIELGKDQLTPILEAVMVEAGHAAIRHVGSELNFNMTPELVSWLDRRTTLFMQSITATTYKKLKVAFEESAAINETRAELIKRIGRTYSGFTPYRSALIARTETHGAYQEATIQGYGQAGIQSKVWITVRDSYVRDTHGTIDGEKQPLNVPFSNGLMKPGDENGPAGEVINCRCTI